MSFRIRTVKVLTIAAVAAAVSLTACSAGSLGSSSQSGGAAETVTVRYLVDNSETTVKFSNAQVEAFQKANPTIKIQVEQRAQGTDGDNVVKTKLATGDMEDMFLYNSGSLIQALDPAKNLAPLTDQPYVSTLDKGFQQSVSVGGQLYGVPTTTATGGGVLYNRKVFADLGLSVPKTWDQFMANNAKIKAAGIDPVIQSYGDTWSSQLFVLADYHNVAAASPGWDVKYTANDPTAKFSTEPAIKGFQRQQAVKESGYMNKDYASLKYDKALTVLASGKGAQYPMLTFAIPTLVGQSAENAENIGFYGLPGDTEATDGMTLWEPSALYIPSSTTGAKLDAAKKFAAFLASPAGCDAQNAAVAPSGPWVIEGCTLPDSVPQAVKDMQAYVDADKATPALEFLSPVKGPNLEKITVEVGSGIATAADGARRYDEDVKKQAQQLGLEGW